MFDKILVANRGEIACRIFRTLKQLRIHSIAIYSDADVNALHTRSADSAIHLDGATLIDSYLNIQQIVQLAVSNGVNAIHPGYGFLSENVEFAEACASAGIAFIGPRAEHIRDFGLKHCAREIAIAAGIPVTSGTGLLLTANDALEKANEIGYPIILKNTAGGGGIGLQVCHSAAEVEEAFLGVTRIGEAQFHGAGVFLEQYVSSGRHIEVQVVGDGKGNVAIIGDRDCSIQRRNQKIIEECPAPDLPPHLRQAMHNAAKTLGESVNYLSVGTVEFIYDVQNECFFFLEVNTRIQVEHTVTEQVYEIDLIDTMIQLSFNPTYDIMGLNGVLANGVAIEVRVNAEDPLHNFTPCPGVLSLVQFPSYSGLRIDSGVVTNSEIPIFFDSMIAKIIVKDSTREEAINKLLLALSETTILGVVTNLDYLSKIISSSAFNSIQLHTKFLDSFTYHPSVIEVLVAGGYTTIQDYPGRVKYWSVGVPPSGPMDDYSFRLGNKLVGNDANCAGIECTLTCPSLLFHAPTLLVITGGKVAPLLNNNPIPMFTPIIIQPGQTLVIGKILSGVRTYICIYGGVQTISYLGSRSMFVQGKFGGIHGNGALLKPGDLIPIRATNHDEFPSNLSTIPPELMDVFTFPSRINIGVLYGPHGAPDFFTSDSIATLFNTDYEVHYNCSRLGVRLLGPAPVWARENGGEAGLHPSNIHDCEYAIGSVNFTGDSPVILTCDGPSLGGFVCPIVIAKAELWKVGQLKPGDKIRFVCISHDTAVALAGGVHTSLATCLPSLNEQILLLPTSTTLPESCLLAELPPQGSRPHVYYRQAGDSNILLEYGDMELNLLHRVRIHSLMKAIDTAQIHGIIELSPGVRSLQIQYNHAVIHPTDLIANLIDIEQNLPNSMLVDVPNRVVRIPMVFEDSGTISAIQRYSETVRATAPWLPSNIEFIRRINGLDSVEDVKRVVYDASYLVLGLGDVYLGAPCAVPVDPTHRLVTSKYSPARTFTSEGTVGIGGVYMCVYGMDSPGGYQLVGKTLPIWSRDPDNSEPWLLKYFDLVSFYEVTEQELIHMRSTNNYTQYIKIFDSIFNMGHHETFLRTKALAIEQFQTKQKIAFDNEVKYWAEDANNSSSNQEILLNTDDILVNSMPLLCNSYGCVWKILVSVGETVNEGQDVLILEAMKMETRVVSTTSGKVVSLTVSCGKMVKTGDILMHISETVDGVELDEPLVDTTPFLSEDNSSINDNMKDNNANEWIFKLKSPLFQPEAVESAGKLAGMTFAVKDNIDVLGCPTTCACPEFSYTPSTHAIVVQNLLNAGAVVIGKTNLDQFACGLNGTRSPYGAVYNAFNSAYVSGGSSSGSSYAVATGQVDFSLGTDTAGSGRVPAGLQNIVGLKPSKGLISTLGVVPAAASADCVSIFARSVQVAYNVLTAAMSFESSDPFSRELPLRMQPFSNEEGVFRFGIPDILEFFGDTQSEDAFTHAIMSLERMGGKKVIIPYAPLAAVASMLYEDAFVAERYSGIREFFDKNEECIIEPVKSIIGKGKKYSAADLYDAQSKVRGVSNTLKKEMWNNIDFIVVPTSPTHYTIQEMFENPVQLNKNLGTYTNFVNLLDYAALSIPSAIMANGLPFGITLIGEAGSDYQLAELGQRYHHSRELNEGALSIPLPPPTVYLTSLDKPSSICIAVVGAHLQGMPLHHQLVTKNAKFLRKCVTASVYNLYAIANSFPPKPALVHVGLEEGVAIEIEIYEMDFHHVGVFLTQIPPPLGLGTLELEGGSTVKGFIAEPRAVVGAENISSFGGWRAYLSCKGVAVDK